MGYRLAVLDPDPDCPAAAVADDVVVGTYDDVDARAPAGRAQRRRHVRARARRGEPSSRPWSRWSRSVRAVSRSSSPRTGWPSGGSSRPPGVGVAPWREIRTTARAPRRGRADALGLPLRLKVAIGGYDGRGQVRTRRRGATSTARSSASAGERGTALLAERELDFEAELSVIVARGLDGVAATFPIARNVHDEGILVRDRRAGAGRPGRSPSVPPTSAGRLAVAMDLVGTLTAELFLLRDGSLVVNELAPRVHNSGHWTIEGAATSQFEQHIRAICGLGLGATDALAPAAMVNLLGTGPRRDRPARWASTRRSPTRPSTCTSTTSGPVFERRKMGHLTALGPDVETAWATRVPPGPGCTGPIADPEDVG